MGQSSISWKRQEGPQAGSWRQMELGQAAQPCARVCTAPASAREHSWGDLQSWPRGAAEFQPSMGSLPPKISVFGECHTTENSRLHHLPVQCQHWGHIKQDSNRLKSLEYKLAPSWGCFLQNSFPFQVLLAHECVHLSTQTGEKYQLFFKGKALAAATSVDLCTQAQ